MNRGLLSTRIRSLAGVASLLGLVTILQMVTVSQRRRRLGRPAEAVDPGPGLRPAPTPPPPSPPEVGSELELRPHDSDPRTSRWSKLLVAEYTVAILLLSVAAYLRFWHLSSAPGWEWDEPNYTNIATNLSEHGRLAIKEDVLSEERPYLFHPPFYFGLLAAWFRLVGAGVYEARVLIAASSIILISLAFILVRGRMNAFAVVPLAALSLDGWLVFSNRIAWFDHIMLVIGVAGLIVYDRARPDSGTLRFVIAGLLLGSAVAFKHVGAYLLLAVVIHWLLTRSDSRKHVALFTAALGVLAAYFAAMFAVFRGDFWFATSVQLGRASGTWNSGGGSVGGAGDVIGPLLHQYRLFYGTIAIALAGLILLLWRVVRMVRTRSVEPVRRFGIVFSWLIAGLLFFGVLQIRFPQYFMMILLPLYLYVSLEVYHGLRGKLGSRPPIRLFVALLGIVLLCLHVLTFEKRIVGRDDNALAAVQDFARTAIPPGELVITEEPIGAMIEQPYCEIWQIRSCPKQAKWLIYYRTALFEPREAYRVNLLRDSAHQVARFTGFKETIVVYRLDAAQEIR